MSDLLSSVPALASHFLGRTRSDIQNLRELLEESKGAPAALARIARIAHGIHGAGAAFGFDAVSESAGALERRVKLHLQRAAAGEAAAAPLPELDALLTTLDAHVNAALREIRTGEIDMYRSRDKGPDAT
jgi:HPt (histidine-containing phosphotransfer) domain-containing protein